MLHSVGMVSKTENLLQMTSLLLTLLVIPNLEGHMLGSQLESRHPTQLRIAEQVTSVQGHPQHIGKRSSQQCGQERLDSVLRSCEAAASALPMVSSTGGPVSSDPLVFCGADCNHKVILYANDCNNGEFLVNVSGACKLGGSNLTVECIYAVVLVKMGITSCTKMALDVDSTHEEVIPPSAIESSREYVDDVCCSLETSYESDVMHVVRADSMGRAVIEPPLEPPWLRTNSSDYQAVIDVVSSELCLVPTTTMEVTTRVTTSLLVTEDSSSVEVVNGANPLLLTQHTVPFLFLQFVLFLLVRFLSL